MRTRNTTARRMALAGALVLGGTLLLASAKPATADTVARATLSACTTGLPLGVAVLRERTSNEGVKEVDVMVRVTERNNLLSAGLHGVHIHEVGDCSAACAAAGGHFDPGPSSNPSPDGNHPFHMGDLVNIEIAPGGQGVMQTTTSRVTISPGPLSVLDANGSAFIIHDGADTYCPDGLVAGCSGGTRAACGIIKPAQ